MVILGGAVIKEIDKRLLRIEQEAERRRIERLRHEPYYQVVPWSIMRDQVTVKYYPEGSYQPPQKFDNLHFCEVVEWALKACENNYVSFSMASCQEWLFLHSQDESDTLYNAEQRQRFKEMWLSDYPELELLLTDEGWKRIGNIIGRLPQNGRVWPKKEGVT